MALGILSLLIANFIGGALSPIFVKLGVREIPPLTFTAFRFILASLFLLPFFLRQRESVSRNKKLIFFNSLFFAGNVALFSIAIQYTTVIISQLIYTFVPVMVGLLGTFFLNERLDKNKLIGSTLAFLGVIFLINQSVSSAESILFGTPLGNILTCMAAFSWSCYLVISKKMHQNYSSVSISLVNFIFTAIFLSLFIPFELSVRSLDLAAITSTGIISLLGVAFFSSVIFIYLLQTGIKKLGPFISSLFGYTGPFFAALAAIPLIGERITLSLVFGGILIIIGAFYATTYSLWINKKNYSK